MINPKDLATLVRIKMPNKLILKIRNSKFMIWLREVNLGELFNVFGLLTIIRNLLFMMVKEERRCNNEICNILTLTYFVFGLWFFGFVWYWPTVAFTEAIFFPWAGKIILTMWFWILVPFIWYDYHDEYNKSK
jgi:hypothetical protein